MRPNVLSRDLLQSEFLDRFDRRIIFGSVVVIFAKKSKKVLWILGIF